MDAIKKTENHINNTFVWTLQSQFENVKQIKPSLRGKGLHFFFRMFSSTKTVSDAVILNSLIGRTRLMHY